MNPTQRTEPGYTMSRRRTALRAAALVAALVMAVPASAKPTYTVLDRAVEMAQVTLHVDSHGIGTAEVRACPSCPTVIYNVTAQTKAYENNKPVPITPDLNFSNQPVNVFYLNNTKDIKLLIWTTSQ